MKKLFLLLFILPIYINAVKVDVSVNKYNISLSDQLTYTLKVSDSSRLNVREPAAPAVNLLSFRNMTSSSASSVSIQGGKVVSGYNTEYTYIYFPQKTGKTTIPSISVNVNGKLYTTRPIEINIVPGVSKNPNMGQSAPPVPAPFPKDFGYPDFWGRDDRDSGTTMLIALPEVQYVYRGFPAVVSYYLYTDEMVRSFNLEDEKDYPGYGKSTFEQPTSLDYEDVRYQGKNYKRALIKRLAIMPSKEGSYVAPQMQGIARLYNFGYLNKSLQSSGGNIVVRPLPRENAPKEFSGAVGNFKVSSSLSKTDIALGEALTFTLKIQGRGNFNQFSAPTFAVGNGFQVSTPVVMDNLIAGIDGSRTYFYTLIPQYKGELRLPDLVFSWFDNDQGEYKKYSHPEQKIEVKAANVLSYLNRIWEPQAPRSMHPKVTKTDYPIYVAYASQAWYWILVGLILLGCAFAAFKANNNYIMRNAPEQYANKQAGRILHKYMKQATAAAQNLSPEFYPLAEKALFDYLATKYKLANHLSTEEKLSLLSESSIPLDLIQDVQVFLLSCQKARFMPEADRAINLQEDLALLKKILASFSRLKNNHLGA